MKALLRYGVCAGLLALAAIPMEIIPSAKADTAQQMLPPTQIGQSTSCTGGNSALVFNPSTISGVSAINCSKVTVTPAGFLGIGTTSPLGALDVRGDSSTNILLGTGGGVVVDVAGNGKTWASAFTIESDGWPSEGENDAINFYLGASGYNNGTGAVGASIQAFPPNPSWNQSNASLTFSTNPNATGGTPVERMRIDSLGNVGIGSTSPTASLDVAGFIKFGSAGSAGSYALYSGLDAYFNGTNWVLPGDGANNGGGLIASSTAGGLTFYTVPSTGSAAQTISNSAFQSANARMTITSGGSVYVSGTLSAQAYYHSSDARLKTNIHPVEHALDKVLAIKGVEFNWKNDGRADMGVVAQNVAEVFPNVVSHNQNGMMAVEYDSLVGPMIEAMRELKTRNDDMKAQIDEVRAEIKALKEENHRLRSIDADKAAAHPAATVEQ